MANTYHKTHAATVIASAAITACRFIGYDGGHARGAGGANDAYGVSETDAQPGQAVACITHFSALVQAGGNFAVADYVKPDATGQAILGSATDHCGRALSTGVAGQYAEIQLFRHTHP